MIMGDTLKEKESSWLKRGVAGVACNDVMWQGFLQIRECDCMTKPISNDIVDRGWLWRTGERGGHESCDMLTLQYSFLCFLFNKKSIVPK
jgi:hypothetical protein